MIGFAHKQALIRFLYKIDPEELSMDEFCKLECEMMWLAEIGMLNVKFE